MRAEAQEPTLSLTLSERSGYVERQEDGFGKELPYFTKSGRYTNCSDCETGAEAGCNDCWWARCDRLLKQPPTLAAMRTYVASLNDDALLRHVESRESLEALVYNEPEGTLQDLLPQTRTEWNTLRASDRTRLIELGRDCRVYGPAPLIFLLTLTNPTQDDLVIREVVHHRLFDYGEAGGGPPGDALIWPEVSYVHYVDFDCPDGGADSSSVSKALTPSFRVAADGTQSLELEAVYSLGGDYDGFLAPIRMRLSLVTSAGTIESPEFLVEGPSCAG